MTLEITHDLDAPLDDWLVQVVDESLGLLETVRVVEEVALEPGWGERLSDERDAAILERQKAEQRADRDSVKCSALADNVITLRARVAELESAPPARGWLTDEEREAVEWFCGSPKAISTEQCDRWKDALCALLARSTPPEVVLPVPHTRTEVNEANQKLPCLWFRRPDVIAALAAAGVPVKEVGRE